MAAVSPSSAIVSPARLRGLPARLNHCNSVLTRRSHDKPDVVANLPLGGCWFIFSSVIPPLSFSGPEEEPVSWHELRSKKWSDGCVSTQAANNVAWESEKSVWLRSRQRKAGREGRQNLSKVLSPVVDMSALVMLRA